MNSQGVRASGVWLFVVALLTSIVISSPSAAAQEGELEPTSGCVIADVAVETIATQPECDALVALYDLTGGPRWTTTAGWATATDPCTWHGIACDDRGVTSLILFDNNLKGPIPLELAQLTNLRKLRLFRNKLSGEIPPELGTMTNLRQLWLRSNKLTGEIPPELGNLTKLDSLWLYGNELTGPIPAQFGQLAKLRVLQLWDNQLTGPIPAELGDASSLQILRAHNNQLTGEIPGELGNIASLESLHLHNNLLTGEIPAALGQLSVLRNLRAENNQLTGAIPPEFAALDSLRRLWLTNNQLSGDITTALAGLTDTLTHLRLADGEDGNDCLSTTDPDLGAIVHTLDPGWDDCSVNQVGCTIDGGFAETLATQSDCDALVALYDSFGGDEWLGKFDWLSEADPCSWRGVTCTELGVTELSLSSRRVRGDLSPAIGDLVNLERLGLGDNLVTSIPPEIGNLTKLQSLDLSRNEFTVLPPEISNLSSLQTLILFSTELTTLPPEIGDLVNLRTLNVRASELRGAIPPELGNLTNLEVLDLWVNGLSGPIPPELGNLTNLHTLNLAGNLLTGTLMGLEGLDSMTTLLVAGNRLSGDITEPMAGIVDTLTVLDLSDGLTGNNCLTVSDAALATRLSALDVGWDRCEPLAADCGVIDTVLSQPECDAINDLYLQTNGPEWTNADGWTTQTDPCTWFGISCDEQGLIAIELANNNLDGRLIDSFGSLIHLQRLDLSDNALRPYQPATESLPPTFGELTSLQHLDLSRNFRLRGHAPLSFYNLTQLQHVDFVQTEIRLELTPAIRELTQLEFLRVTGVSGTLGPEIGNLTKLRRLDLRPTFGLNPGPLPTEIFTLTELRELSIGGITANDSAPLSSEIANLTKLKDLDLGFSGFSEIPTEIGSLTRLRSLFLGANNLASLPPELGNLPLLTELGLYNNTIAELPVELADLPLRSLDLRRNLLTGDVTTVMAGIIDTMELLSIADGTPGGNDCLTVTDPALAARLSGLSRDWDECETDVLGCVIDGIDVETRANQQECDALIAIHDALGGSGALSRWAKPTDPCGWTYVRCSSRGRGIYALELVSSKLSGQIPADIAKLSNLESLTLGTSFIEYPNIMGPIPAEIGTMSNLKSLTYGLTLPLPDELGDLEGLIAFRFNGHDVAPIPAWASDLALLRTLQADDVIRPIPSGITSLTDLASLAIVIEPGTELPLGLGNLTELTSLSLSGFTGSIPADIGNLSKLTTVGLRSDMTGSIPPELGNLTNLQTLNLFDNQLTGSIPPELGELERLRTLNLSGNKLTGSIPPELGELERVYFLYLDDNQLSGPIPAELGNLGNLEFFEAANNQLTGPLPAELANLRLAALLLTSNDLTGPIPAGLGNAVLKLDLGNNRLSGPIPPDLEFGRKLKTLVLENNELTGPLPRFGNGIVKVDISGNQLSGPMPEGITIVSILDLRDNQLSGTLPALAGRMRTLRLANNLLTGDLTVGLAGVIDGLSRLDLSDGAGGNDCFTITDSVILGSVAQLDANWDECEQ